MYRLLKKTILVALFFTFNFLQAGELKIDLSGNWQVQTDSTDIGLQQNWHNSPFEQQIKLPGTTDDAGLGIANTLTPKLERPQVLRLTRKNSYVGPAWYTREIVIPKKWKNKQLTLKLERVIWETRVWINGREVQSKQESLSTPHYFDLTSYLKPGKQRLTVKVDNRRKYDISVHLMAHAYTNETQIIWNGILGEISCIAEEKIRIDEIQVYPDVENKRIKVRVDILNFSGKKLKSELQMAAVLQNNAEAVAKKSYPVQINSERESFTFDYPMGASPALWDEFNPNLYTLNVSLGGRKALSSKQTQFGMRELGNKNTGLQVNGKNIFLRGTLECAIFPLTGYPPMEKEGWRKLMLSAREWGLNHLRFHSWCPPKAAFEAADELGFYLQAELPLWSLNINKDEPTNQFLFAEADRIIREYGNHPSFCYWSLGNELQPDFKFLNEFVDKLKQKDPRRLYTNTSFTFEKGHGKWPERNDDFFITQYTDKGWVRGQGVFDTEPPTFTKDYAQSVAGLPVPLITHEIGQYAVYPNLEEIKKYTGVLDPLNFKAVKADLEQKGLVHKAQDYMMASGKLAAILYKEEIERALKTAGISGFQLLDLHDFPGQGTALVGLLDAFWDSKGLIDAAKFREFCAPVVPLIRFEKAAYTNNETFTASMEVTNYGKDDLKNKRIFWAVKDGAKIIQSGYSKPVDALRGTLTTAGKMDVKLNGITRAAKLSVELSVEGTEYRNSWEIWVYPANQTINTGSVVVTSDKEEALLALETGKKVLFSPKTEKIQGLEGKFVQVFWSPVHFPNQPGTMGLLVNPSHPAFKLFPTEMHTNWQWWDLCKKSRTINIDNIPGATAIVENVDNFMKNRRLCSVFEAQSGNGNLIFSSMDLTSNIDNRPEAKQFLISVLEYMNSKHFNPSGKVNQEELKQLLTE
jgi:hypothetical protein